MSQLLRSLTIKDFRSIKGEIGIELDAPLVLIHAANATGKTSVMSAIELALTRQLPGFERVDSQYRKYLVNSGAEQARITLTTTGGQETTVVVRDEVVKGDPFLSAPLHQYFNERCYLGQAMLSRLLEWYSPSNTQEESPLAAFVNDLLGVDRLDALIAGLHTVADVRRLRSAMPELGDVESHVERLTLKCEDLTATIKSATEQERYQVSQLIEVLHVLAVPVALSDGVFELPSDRSLFVGENDKNLSWWSTQRLRLATIRESWLATSSKGEPGSKSTLEDQVVAAQSALKDWEIRYGQTLSRFIAELEGKLTNVPNPSAADPVFAVDTAITILTSEISRCKKNLESDDSTKKEVAELIKGLTAQKDRLEKLEQRIEQLDKSADELVRAYTSLIPFIVSDACPICDRDYHEVSPETLLAHVTNKINILTGRGEIYRSLSQERRDAEHAIAVSQRKCQSAVAAQLPTDAAATLKSRTAEFTDALSVLQKLRPQAQTGSLLRMNAADADRALSFATKRSTQDTALGSELKELAIKLGEPVPTRSESIEAIIKRLSSAIEEHEAQLTERAGMLKAVESKWLILSALRRDLTKAKDELSVCRAELKEVRRRIALFDEARDTARGLRSAAQRAKTTVVRRVFTDGLNAAWRELFIRLAPNEQFIPRFVVPDVRGSGFKIELETLHKKGNLGGTPRAMLSTGNLNTAALSLFLALNISVEARVPLLMLDDPVQSMDEVHISQLAALLRMMSKHEQNQRQIIIAVHERSLFEYLRFELAPSYGGDSLRTAELDRTMMGTSVVTNRFVPYEQETAVA
jgi:DNA repair protein SbcC/Rad50